MQCNTRKRICLDLVTSKLVIFLLIADAARGSRQILQVDFDQLQDEINVCGYDQISHDSCNEGHMISSASLVYNSYGTSPDVWPYIVSFQRPTNTSNCFMHACSGILTSPTTVMTSGACIRLLNFLQYNTPDIQYYSKIISDNKFNKSGSSSEFNWPIRDNSMYYLPSDVYVSNVPYCRNDRGSQSGQRIKTITMEILQSDDDQNHDFDVILIHTQHKVKYDSTIYPYPSSTIRGGDAGWTVGWLNSKAEDISLNRGYNQFSLQKGQVMVMDLDVCKNLIKQRALSVHWPDEEDHIFCGYSSNGAAGCSGGIGSPLILEDGYFAPSWDNTAYEFAGVLAEVPEELCNPESQFDFFLGIYVRYLVQSPPPAPYYFNDYEDDHYENEFDEGIKSWDVYSLQQKPTNEVEEEDDDEGEYNILYIRSETPSPELYDGKFTDQCGFTKQGCKCKQNWEYEGQSFNGCQNPDNDIQGKWCFISDDSIITHFYLKQTNKLKYEIFDYCLNEC